MMILLILIEIPALGKSLATQRQGSHPWKHRISWDRTSSWPWIAIFRNHPTISIVLFSSGASRVDWCFCPVKVVWLRSVRISDRDHEALGLEAQAEYRHSTWRLNKNAEPQRPLMSLMHTTVYGSSWINRMRVQWHLKLGACIKTYIFFRSKTDQNYVANLKLNTSLSIPRYEDMIRYD